MADIKQAAKWMEDGKRVRRPHLSRDVAIGRAGHGTAFMEQLIVCYVGSKKRQGQDSAPLLVEDLLADDWEIAG